LKTIITFILMSLSIMASDPKDYLDDPTGFHGMLLFGSGEHFYISHLPMWMKPHDYQMIAKVTLNQSTKEILNKEKAKGVTLFSAAPNGTFVLPKYANGDLPSFQADIFKGHFERDGIKIGSAQVVFEKLIHFKKLKKSEPSPSPNKQKYVLFGEEDSQYIVHIAHGFPELDEILEITPFQDPNIKNKLIQKNSIQLICNTKDEEKNMKGLDESAPQNCEIDKDDMTCEECEKTLSEVSPSQSIKDDLNGLFNSIMIKEDIYTDTNDLGMGM